MSIFNDKALRSVAEAAAKVMQQEELKGNQHKIDANKNGKVDAHDFKLLRGKKEMQEGMKGAAVGGALGAMAGGPVGAAVGGALGHVAGEKLSSAKNKVKSMYGVAKGPSMSDSNMKREEIEQLDEVGDTPAGRKALGSYVNKAIDDNSKDRSKGLRKATSRLYKDNFYGKKNEEVEQLDEVGDTPAGRKALGSYVNKAIDDKSKDRSKGLRKATSRLYKDNFYGKKNEEVEMNEEDAYNKDRYAVKNGKATKDNPTHMGSPSYKDQPHHVWATSAEHAVKKSMKKEETELDEAFPTVADAQKRMNAGKTASGSVTKTKTGLVHKRDYKDDDAEEAQKKSTGYGARQNFKRSTRVNESASFTEMLELYNEHGLKVLAPIETEEIDIDGTTIEVLDGDKINGFVQTEIEEGIMDVAKGAVGVVKDVISKEKDYQAQKQKKAGDVLRKLRKEESMSEESTNDEFTKEYEDQKASFEGKKKQPKIAAGKTTGVKEMPESVELEERELSTGEAKKKEEYVKGMKKGLSGFKERYGDRAKSVMYATATKMAKKD